MSVLRRNTVTVMGNGQTPMLFAHGYGCDQNMWRLIAPAFADCYRLILLDHVGAGRSDLSAYDRDKYRSLQGYVDNMLEICKVLGVRHGVFVGHSVSAMIGVLAAIQEPDRFDHADSEHVFWRPDRTPGPSKTIALGIPVSKSATMPSVLWWIRSDFVSVGVEMAT